MKSIFEFIKKVLNLPLIFFKKQINKLCLKMYYQ